MAPPTESQPEATPTVPADDGEGDDADVVDAGVGKQDDAESSTSRDLMILIAIAVIAFVVYVNVRADDDSSSIDISSFDTPALVEITYEVTGSARSVSITLETPTGTSQASNRSVPLTSTSGGRGLTMTFNRGDFVYISAQNDGERGSVTCRIRGTNGDLISTSTSEGAYVIASCDGEAR